MWKTNKFTNPPDRRWAPARGPGASSPPKWLAQHAGSAQVERVSALFPSQLHSCTVRGGRSHTPTHDNTPPKVSAPVATHATPAVHPSALVSAGFFFNDKIFVTARGSTTFGSHPARFFSAFVPIISSLCSSAVEAAVERLPRRAHRRFSVFGLACIQLHA